VAAAIPGARFISLPGPGHASYVEAPAAFNAELTSFIGGHV
jgi:pimeloyl-ACP methyl ester carboxylesterase